MEVYVLDSLLRRTTVVDVFQSLIWTERWVTAGDFQLDIVSTPATRRLFTAGTKLAVNKSMRVMTVESIEDDVANNGTKLLTLKGRSLEATVLENRVVRNALTDTITEPSWTITGTPQSVMNTMFDHIVRLGSLSPSDTIPYLQPGSIMPVDTIPAPTDSITWVQDPDSLYNALNKLGSLYGLGFRIIRNFDLSQLYFDVYSGSDRTTSQTVLAPVVFSPGLENLQNTKELVTIDQKKNVAYVTSDQGFRIVYDSTSDATTAGFDRNVMWVKADNLTGTPTPEQVQAYLLQLGREALAQNQAMAAFDGEISQYSQYVYGVDYNLGDLVEQRNIDGIANQMRVTEQIFTHDGNGEKSYPTLTTYQFVNIGSWLAWPSNQVWADLDSNTTAWADQA